MEYSAQIHAYIDNGLVVEVGHLEKAMKKLGGPLDKEIWDTMGITPGDALHSENGEEIWEEFATLKRGALFAYAQQYYDAQLAKTAAIEAAFNNPMRFLYEKNSAYMDKQPVYEYRCDKHGTFFDTDVARESVRCPRKNCGMSAWIIRPVPDTLTR